MWHFEFVGVIVNFTKFAYVIGSCNYKNTRPDVNVDRSLKDAKKVKVNDYDVTVDGMFPSLVTPA